MQRQRPQRAAAVAANAGLSFDGTGPNPAVAPPPQSSVRYNAPDADVDERPVLELPQELEVVKTHIETLLSELGEGEMMTSAEIRDAVLGPGAPWKLTARRGNPPKPNIIMRALLIDWPQAWEAGGALPDSPWAKHDSSRHSRFSANAPEWQDAKAEAWNYFEPLVELIVDGNAFVEPTPRNWSRPETYGYKAEDELRYLGSNFTWRDLLAAESIYGSSDREDALIKRSVKEMISCGEAKPSDKATPFFVLPGQGPAFDLTPTQHPNLLKRLAEYEEFAYLRKGSYVTALHSKSETVHLGLAVKDPAFEIGSLKKNCAARRDGVCQPMYSFGFAGMQVTSHSATLSERAEVETETPGVDEDVRVRCWQVDEEVPPELRAASGVGFTLHPSMGFDHKTGKFTIVHLRVGAVASEAAGGVVLKAPELMKFVPTFLGKEDDDAWKSWGNSRVDLEKYSVGNVIFGISMGLGGSHRLVRKYCADAFDSFPWMLVNELYNATDAKELDQFWIWRHWHWAYLDVTIAPAGAALQHDRSGAAHDIVIPKMARCGIPEFGKYSELFQEMKSVKGYGRGGEMKLMLKSIHGRETQPKIVACTVAFDMGVEEERSLEAARHRHWILEEWKRRGGEGWREDRAAFRGAFEAHLVANASANFRVGMIATSDFKKKSDEALWRYVDTKSDVPIATQLKDGYNFVLGRNARAIARPRTHHNRHLRRAEKGYLGLKAFEIAPLTGTARRAMQAKAKAIQAQMEDFASPPGGNPWDEALANLDQGLAAADRQARDDATRAGLDGEKGWRAAGPYVGCWITKNVLDGEGASYVGQVVGYLSAGQSDYVDAQGAAAALWHVSNVSGELGDDGEDLEEWQLLASDPRPTRPGGPEESSPGDDDAGRIGGPEESSPGDDDDAVLARVPMEKLLDTLIKRSAELHRPADQKRRDDRLLEAARALTYAATSAYFDRLSMGVDQLEHGLRRPDHEIDWDVEMPGVDPRRYAGLGACQLARLSTCALDRARALADANADRVTALSKPDVEAQLEERDLSTQNRNDARLFRAFCRDMPAPAAATATAALPAGAALPSPASPVVGASEPVAAEPTVAATPAPVSSRLRSSTAPRKRKRDAIDKMTTGELKKELKKLKLDTDGKKAELQDRLLGALGLVDQTV